MNHPPTGCDRSLFLDEHGKPLVITHGDIAKAVSWYEQNWNRISTSLPITIFGTTYTVRWQERFDYYTLPQWRAGKLTKYKNTAYVYWALKRLAQGFRERADP